MIVRRRNPNTGEWQGYEVLVAVPFSAWRGSSRWLEVSLSFEAWRGSPIDRLCGRVTQ